MRNCGTRTRRVAAAHDASVVTYPEARHDLQLELGLPALADAMYAWLLARRLKSALEASYWATSAQYTI